MADAVTFLEAALGRAEELSRAAELAFPSELWDFPLSPHSAVNDFNIANTPAAVLRRVKADRALLAEHIEAAPLPVPDGHAAR